MADATLQCCSFSDRLVYLPKIPTEGRDAVCTPVRNQTGTALSVAHLSNVPRLV